MRAPREERLGPRDYRDNREVKFTGIEEKKKRRKIE